MMAESNTGNSVIVTRARLVPEPDRSAQNALAEFEENPHEEFNDSVEVIRLKNPKDSNVLTLSDDEEDEVNKESLAETDAITSRATLAADQSLSSTSDSSTTTDESCDDMMLDEATSSVTPKSSSNSEKDGSSSSDESMSTADQVKQRRFDVVEDEHQKTHISTSKANIFDSHCHLDRVFFQHFRIQGYEFHDPTSSKMRSQFDYWKVNDQDPLAVLRKKYSLAFSEKFEGCIHVICNPLHFGKGYWEWIATSKSKIWLTLGCHPSAAANYDDKSEWELERAMKHPKVVALGTPKHYYYWPVQYHLSFR